MMAQTVLTAVVREVKKDVIILYSGIGEIVCEPKEEFPQLKHNIGINATIDSLAFVDGKRKCRLVNYTLTETPVLLIIGNQACFDKARQAASGYHMSLIYIRTADESPTVLMTLPTQRSYKPSASIDSSTYPLLLKAIFEKIADWQKNQQPVKQTNVGIEMLRKQLNWAGLVTKVTCERLQTQLRRLTDTLAEEDNANLKFIDLTESITEKLPQLKSTVRELVEAARNNLEKISSRIVESSPEQMATKSWYMIMDQDENMITRLPDRGTISIYDPATGSVKYATIVDGTEALELETIGDENLVYPESKYLESALPPAIQASNIVRSYSTGDSMVSYYHPPVSDGGYLSDALETIERDPEPDRRIRSRVQPAPQYGSRIRPLISTPTMGQDNRVDAKMSLIFRPNSQP